MKYFISVISVLFCCSCLFGLELGNIRDTENFSGVDNPADRAAIIRFVSTFEKERPISTTPEDAYPKASGIQDFKPNPASKEIMETLGRHGHVVLKPGVYDFYLQAFCLNAGKYAPKSSGSSYLVAPLKGSQADAVKHLLQNYPKHPEIKQSEAQYLIWAIEVGCKFSDLPDQEQAAAQKILSKEDLQGFNSSLWDILPKPLRVRLFGELANQLPDDVRGVLEVYNEIQNKIAISKYSYEQLEKMAVISGEPPAMEKQTEAGTWFNTGKGYYTRVFEDGFKRARVQVYIPNKSGISDFNPASDIGMPANTSYQRIAVSCAGK
jgi:hypothetical protein